MSLEKVLGEMKERAGTKLSEKLISWASILEENTLEQAQLTSTMPFIFPHLALMPDAHLGRGATVGSVIPTSGAIIPAAVGVDIGCGMNASRTNLLVDDLGQLDLRELRLSIERSVPLSPGRVNRKLTESAAARVQKLEELAEASGFNPDSYAKNWRLQLGSLGGGNHFIEICQDEEGRVWSFLHSGSRGIGNRIASHHIKVAAEYMKRNFISLPDPDLAYLVEGTPEFDAYMSQMMWAQDFAAANRAEMEERVLKDLRYWFGGEVTVTEHISCHHNYTQREKHFGKEVWLSRKGAIDAHEGVAGLIPGSMGDRSYVVVGKGNPVALASAPHGAGRAYSRSAARKEFTLDDLRNRMVGIEFRDDEAFVDEIPDAYKPIAQVMTDADPLVEVKHELRQLLNVKGQ